jgi:hypothetical protein
MANKTLFASLRDALMPQTNTINSENAPAYALAPKQASLNAEDDREQDEQTVHVPCSFR